MLTQARPTIMNRLTRYRSHVICPLSNGQTSVQQRACPVACPLEIHCRLEQRLMVINARPEKIVEILATYSCCPSVTVGFIVWHQWGLVGVASCCPAAVMVFYQLVKNAVKKFIFTKTVKLLFSHLLKFVSDIYVM